MGQKTILIAVAAVAVLGIGGAYALQQRSDTTKVNDASMVREAADEKKNAETAAMKESETAAMKKEQTGEVMKKDGAAMAKGIYTDYDASKLANAENGKVVLFFHAPWCPTCKEANKNFEASQAPDGLTLLKVDYDSSNDLKKKYGITYQHTFVQVDKDGKLLKKWNGSKSYDEIKNQEL